MFFNGELTAGAIGIMLTIVTTGVSGVGAIVGIYFKTRTDITRLQISYLDLKADVADVRAQQAVMIERTSKQDIMLERISTRIELMGAINGLPDQLAVAIGKLTAQDKRAS